MEANNQFNDANLAALRGKPALPPLESESFTSEARKERLIEIGTGKGEPKSDLRSFAPQDFDLSPEKSTPVISGAQKFILPVPAFKENGEELVNDKGETIKDWQGKPIGDRGIVFFNAKDNSLQAACGDGQAVVIINQVSVAQADKIHAKVRSLAADPMRLTLSGMKEILAYAQNELGLSDMYNSDRGFIAKKMTPVAADNLPRDDAGNTIPAFGLMKRDDRDICLAQYVPGRCSFSGPTATPQLFDAGMVVVKVGSSVHAVQPKVFAETYRHADGRAMADPAVEVRASA